MTDQDVYDALVQYWRTFSVPPTVRRLALLAGCGQTTAYYYVGKLKAKGLVQMVDKRPVPVEIQKYLNLFQPAVRQGTPIVLQKESV